MTSISRLILASSNSGKLREFRRLLAPLGIVPLHLRRVSDATVAEQMTAFVVPLLYCAIAVVPGWYQRRT